MQRTIDSRRCLFRFRMPKLILALARATHVNDPKINVCRLLWKKAKKEEKKIVHKSFFRCKKTNPNEFTVNRSSLAMQCRTEVEHQ